MSAGMLYIPSLEEYAKLKRSTLSNPEALTCETCRYCRESVNACVFGNQVRNLDYMDSCPRINKLFQRQIEMK